jgi:hypothetical protein
METPAHNRFDTTATHIGDELVERRSSILRAGDALVDVLDGVPSS